MADKFPSRRKTCQVFVFSHQVWQLTSCSLWSNDRQILDRLPQRHEWWLVRVKLVALPVSRPRHVTNLWHYDHPISYNDHCGRKNTVSCSLILALHSLSYCCWHNCTIPSISLLLNSVLPFPTLIETFSWLKVFVNPIRHFVAHYVFVFVWLYSAELTVCRSIQLSF